MIGNCEYISQSSFESHQVNLKVEILETADNLSLWMELPSGYDKWKRSVVDQVTAMIEWTKRKVQNRKGLFRQALRQSIDRLWFFSTFETFRSEKGYFSEGRYHMLKLNMINTCRLENLGIIPIGETFPQSSSQKDKYVLVKMPLDVTVRNNEGQISRMERKTVVSREGNLSQNSEDSESKMVRRVISSTQAQRTFVPNHIFFTDFPIAGDINYSAEKLRQSSYYLPFGCIEWLCICLWWKTTTFSQCCNPFRID
jgi:hypothetical protein